MGVLSGRRPRVRRCGDRDRPDPRAWRAGEHTWYYFAIFAGVIVGLVLEAVPGTAVGVTLVTVLCEWVFYSPE
jgi:hypothetical protein